MKPDPDSAVGSSSVLDGYLARYPHLLDRIIRQLQVALHEKGAISIDDLYEKARG